MIADIPCNVENACTSTYGRYGYEKLFEPHDMYNFGLKALYCFHEVYKASISANNLHLSTSSNILETGIFTGR
jgi:hypothetical protein